jgi:hypothetical protein
MGGVYSYENFLATFNTDSPETIVEIFGITQLQSQLIIKDLIGAWSLAVFLSIEGNGVLMPTGYLNFKVFDMVRFTFFLTQQRRARRVQFTGAINAVTNRWKAIYQQSKGSFDAGTTDARTVTGGGFENTGHVTILETGTHHPINGKTAVLSKNMRNKPDTSPLTVSHRNDLLNDKSVLDRSILVDQWTSPTLETLKAKASFSKTDSNSKNVTTNESQATRTFGSVLKSPNDLLKTQLNAPLKPLKPVRRESSQPAIQNTSANQGSNDTQYHSLPRTSKFHGSKDSARNLSYALREQDTIIVVDNTGDILSHSKKGTNSRSRRSRRSSKHHRKRHNHHHASSSSSSASSSDSSSSDSDSDTLTSVDTARKSKHSRHSTKSRQSQRSRHSSRSKKSNHSRHIRQQSTKHKKAKKHRRHHSPDGDDGSSSFLILFIQRFSSPKIKTEK